MFSLVEAISVAIENRVIALRTVESYISPGETEITLSDVRGYNPGDYLVIYEAERAEIHRVASITNESITLCDPVTSSYSTDAQIQKTHGTNLVNTVYRGDPATPTYPAITVSLASRERETLTLSDTQDEYTSVIRCYVDVTQDHEQQYALLLNLTHTIENSLYIPLYLRLPPFCQTTLAEPVTGGDTLIKTVDPLPRSGDLVIEDAGRSRNRSMITALGNNVYELNYPLPPFDAGSTVIQLLVHSYDPQVVATEYGNAEDGDRSLRYSEVYYSVKIQRQRNKTVVL